MTVKEFIKELKKFNPNSGVGFRLTDAYDEGSEVCMNPFSIYEEEADEFNEWDMVDNDNIIVIDIRT